MEIVASGGGTHITTIAALRRAVDVSNDNKSVDLGLTSVVADGNRNILPCLSNLSQTIPGVFFSSSGH